MKNLENKLVVITGAGSGIGRALARDCVARGARVAISDVDESGLADTAALLPAERVHAEVLDVAKRAQWTRHRRNLIKRFGESDVVVNNAGVAVSQTIEDLSYEDFDWLMDINFWGVVYGTKTFLADLKSRPDAAVINISSVFGLISVPTQGAYNASKFAVRGFTEALRQELTGTPVHVMSVHPGGIRTNIARNARMHASPTGDDRDTAVSRFDKLAMTSPEGAARRILKDLAARKPRCLIGADAHAIDWVQRALPSAYSRLLTAALSR